MIRWTNVFLAGLLVVGVIVAIQGAPQIGAFLATIDQIGVGNPDDQVKGLLAVGLLGVIVVCVARILVQKNDRGDQKGRFCRCPDAIRYRELDGRDRATERNQALYPTWNLLRLAFYVQRPRRHARCVIE